MYVCSFLEDRSELLIRFFVYLCYRRVVGNQHSRHLMARERAITIAGTEVIRDPMSETLLFFSLVATQASLCFIGRNISSENDRASYVSPFGTIYTAEVVLRLEKLDYGLFF